MSLLSPPPLSTNALKNALSARNIELSYEECESILEEMGMLDPLESEDHASPDRSLWAEEFSFRIAKKLRISPITCYNVLRSFEENLLFDLFFKGKTIKIPHCVSISLVDGRLSVLHEKTDVRREIENILDRRKIRNRLSKIRYREKKLENLNGNFEEAKRKKRKKGK